MSFPSIPDSLGKLFILLGLVCFGYNILKTEANENNYAFKQDLIANSLDSARIEVMKLEHQDVRLREAARAISLRYGIKNPLQQTDSGFFFIKTVTGDKKEVAISDSIDKLVVDFKENVFKTDLFLEKISLQNKVLDKVKNQYKRNDEEYTNILIIGAFLLLTGIITMSRTENLQEKILLKQINENKGKFSCQSCGKKINSIRLSGKNTDGTINTDFCSSCYTNGQFSEPELKFKQLLQRAHSEVKTNWLGKIAITKKLKKLDRWNNDEYFD